MIRKIVSDLRSNQIFTGVIVALATAFFTSRFYVHQATTDLRNEYQKRFNEEKWQTYTGFSDTVRDILKSTKDRKLQEQLPATIDKLYDFTSDLWLIGSDDVVQSFIRWRSIGMKAEEDPNAGVEALICLADILIEMRKDLGDIETEITARDILATFISDIDVTMPKDSK